MLSDEREEASKFVSTFSQVVAQNELQWHVPTISHNSDNSIEVSWWKSNKSLIVTIEPDGPLTFLKVWGPNINNDMDAGQILSDEQLITLWRWLAG